MGGRKGRSCDSCASGFLSLGLAFGVLQHGAVAAAGLGHGLHALDAAGRLQQEGDHLPVPSRRRVRPTLLFGRSELRGKKKRANLLVVVGRQQEQEREGESYVGALGHVLVRHFPLRDTKHNLEKDPQNRWFLRYEGCFETSGLTVGLKVSETCLWKPLEVKVT